MEPRKIDKEYVDGLARPLVRYTSEPPHDALTVLAIAVQGALYEAWEQVEHGERHLRMFPNGLGVDVSHGEIMAGKRVIRRVADVLRLFQPGPNATPGERLLAARSVKYLTHQQLADAAGVHRAHISHIEKGRRGLTRPVAVLLADILGVTPGYLLTGEDPDDAATRGTHPLPEKR